MKASFIAYEKDTGRPLDLDLGAGIPGLAAQLLLDPHQLVVLRDPLGASGRASLDLPDAGRHHEVGDERVLRLT